MQFSQIREQLFIWGTSHPGWPPKRLIGNSPFNKKTQANIRNYDDIGFSAIKRVDVLIEVPFKVDALVLRSIKLFISWRSAPPGSSRCDLPSLLHGRWNRNIPFANRAVDGINEDNTDVPDSTCKQ